MRLFFSLWPPIEVAEQLAGIARSVASQLGGKPTRQDSIHLTLAFLGDVPEERLSVLTTTAQTIRSAPFALDIDSLGYWPRKHLLWAGNTTPCAALGTLVDELWNALSEAGFAGDGRNRAFSPHITLIRKLPEAREPPTLPAIDPIRWRCSSFALIRSEKSDSGSSYRTLADFPLG